MLDSGPNITEIPWVSLETALALLEHEPWAACLDSGGPVNDIRARWSFLCPMPTQTLEWRRAGIIRNGTQTNGDIWEHLRRMTQHPASAFPRPIGSSSIPFTGGIVGMVSYDAGLSLERIPPRNQCGTPRLIAASYEDILAFDRLEQRCWWISRTGKPVPVFPNESTPRPRCVVPLAPEQSREEWTQSVKDMISFIEAGDIFQANLTMRWFGTTPPAFDELATYRTLRQSSPAPFGAYLKTPSFSLLSASVERFLSLSATGLIETRPIKGTAPLGETSAETLKNRRNLKTDEKELAENLMITDLMRNDIGRVSEIGSVSVPQLSEVEEFTHLLHLISEVRGRLRPELDAVDLLKATLPPGSVTGAPKKRAMELIDRLEVSSRGAYCGTAFRIGYDGALDSSVIIRSISRTGRELSLGAGGGITWLSNPEREYEEMLLKAKALLEIFQQ